MKPNAAGAAAPSSAASSRPGLLERLFPAFMFVTAAAILAVYVDRWPNWIAASALQTTDDAYVRADVTPLAARVAGYVRRVDVRDYQAVKSGELLVELVDDDYKAQVAQSEADVAAASAAIDNNHAQRKLQDANVAAAAATLQSAKAELVRAHLDAVRQRELLATGNVASRKTVEQSDAADAKAAAAVDQAEAQLKAQQNQIVVLDAQLKQLDAALLGKRAVLDVARINLGYTRIIAPSDGLVGERQVKPGQYVGIGTQLIAVVPPRVWVTANFKETQLSKVAVGQPVTVTVDTFPGLSIRGTVEEVAPASGSQFALLPPDNATGNFTKVVQRIPVKIALPQDDPTVGRLRAGMSVVATIDTTSDRAPSKEKHP